MKELDLLALLVGAGLAIAGGLVGQLVAFWLKSAESKKLYKRDKLDQLVLSLIEDHHWFDDYRNSLCFGDGKYPRHEPFDRVVTATSLFFRKELFPNLQPLIKARFELRKAINDVYVDRLNTAMANNQPSVGSALPKKEKVAEVEHAFQSYYSAFTDVRDACSSLAQKIM